jgi:hypothetical protein
VDDSSVGSAETSDWLENLKMSGLKSTHLQTNGKPLNTDWWRETGFIYVFSFITDLPLIHGGTQ